MSVENPKSKMLIVDTEQYSGNFERQMCAYVTGQTGECGVGQDIAEKYAHEIKHLDWWEEHIVWEADDRGCSRPTSIWSTPGWFNNGLGGHYKENINQEEKARQDAYEYMKKYNQGQLDMVTKRLAENDFDNNNPHGWTKEACERTLKSLNDSLEAVKNSTAKYPAYQSVVIFVDEFPPKEVWEEFQARAKAYCDNCVEIEKSVSKYQFSSKSQGLTLTGYRQLEPSYKLKARKKT